MSNNFTLFLAFFGDRRTIRCTAARATRRSVPRSSKHTPREYVCSSRGISRPHLWLLFDTPVCLSGWGRGDQPSVRVLERNHEKMYFSFITKPAESLSFKSLRGGIAPSKRQNTPLIVPSFFCELPLQWEPCAMRYTTIASGRRWEDNWRGYKICQRMAHNLCYQLKNITGKKIRRQVFLRLPARPAWAAAKPAVAVVPDCILILKTSSVYHALAGSASLPAIFQYLRLAPVVKRARPPV